MANILTQEEADELIAILKKCVDFEMYLPQKGSREEYEVRDVDTFSEIFTVFINRRNKFNDKCSFTLRYKKTNSILLRLDTNPTRAHTNPDGEVISGTHIHRYVEGFDEKFAMAVNFDSSSLEQDLLYFLNVANIEEPAKIGTQLNMEN